MISLHLIDPTSSDEALEMLAMLIARSAGVSHRVAVLGHFCAGERAIRAGVPHDLVQHVSSVGWLDPSGWRGVRKLIRAIRPTHLHAWGYRGVVASAVQSAFSGARIATITVAPNERQMKLLRAAEGRAPFAWVASSSSVQRELATRGLKNPVRIRPGVAIAQGNLPSSQQIRADLEIPADHGPVILIGGESVRGARHNLALWAVGIFVQLYPKTRCILRLGRDAQSDEMRTFSQTMAPGDRNCEVPIIAEEQEFSWQTLCRAADIFLVTPDEPINTGSVLTAMAAGVPIIGTATPEISELVEHGRSGLLCAPGTVKLITARLYEFMNDSRLRWPLTDAARTDVYAHFKPRYMVECWAALYAQTLADPAIKKEIELPAPELTAADRFAGVVATN